MDFGHDYVKSRAERQLLRLLATPTLPKRTASGYQVSMVEQVGEEMVDHFNIRGAFIRAYAIRQAESNRKSDEMISERNLLLMGLNRRFGFSEPNGSFGIGCKTHVDLAYKAEYDRIESDFKGPYDANLPNLDAWCSSEGMTIWECLLIDNLWQEDLLKIAALSEKTDDWTLYPIVLKARFEVNRLASEYYIGEVRRRLDMMIGFHGYASVRCRKTFKVPFWDVPRQLVILSYQRKWKTALNQAFGRLSAAPELA